MNKKNKNVLEIDGIVEIPKEDFHSFPGKVCSSKDSSFVTIPSEIRHHLNIQKGSYLLVAIKVLTEKEAVSIFGYKSKHNPKTVTCPICGKIGTAHISNRRTKQEWINVTHCKKHGFSKQTYHCCPKKTQVNLKQQIMELEGNEEVSDNRRKERR